MKKSIRERERRETSEWLVFKLEQETAHTRRGDQAPGHLGAPYSQRQENSYSGRVHGSPRGDVCVCVKSLRPSATGCLMFQMCEYSFGLSLQERQFYVRLNCGCGFSLNMLETILTV